MGAQLGGGALGDDLTAQPPGPGPKSSRPSALGDHLAVVLDQQQGVAQVAELLQASEQAAIVAGMQPDGRLVEDIEHAAQPAADLGGQADALHFAAGERAGRPGQRQVVQAHVDEELDAVANLAEHFAGDLALGVVGLPRPQFGQQLAQRQPAIVVDGAVVQAHGRGVVAQPAAAADGALDFFDEVFEPVAEAGRDAAGFFQGGIKALVLEAEA